MKLVTVDEDNKIAKVFKGFPVMLPSKRVQKRNILRERLDPLPAFEQAAEESADDYSFRVMQAIKQWVDQPRTETIEEEVDAVEAIESRLVASWIQNNQQEELVKRGLRVIRRQEQPDYERRNSSLQIVELQVGDEIKDFESWEVVPFDDQRILQLISAECRRRIFVEADEVTQMNMTAAATSGTLNEAQMDLYRDALAWVNAMRTRAADLAANVDRDYFEDDKWPEPAQALRDFVAQF